MNKTGKSKIISFPGVLLKTDRRLNNALDDFLKEMGYIEAPEFRGCLQSDRIQDTIDNFLREMGYIE